MNKAIVTLLGLALASGSLPAHAQDARPQLASDSPTPGSNPSSATTPSTSAGAAATDESAMASDSSKTAEQAVSSDPILGGSGKGFYNQKADAFDKLDEKRPFAAQPPSPANGITLDQAVQTALERNADILKQIAEIKRTRGQVVEIRAQALPHLAASASYNQSQSLTGSTSISSRSTSTEGSTGTTTSTGTAGTNGGTVIGTALVNGVEVPVTSLANSTSNSSYSSGGADSKSWDISFQVTQVIYSGGQVTAALRAARIAEDSAFYQLRSTVDQVIASVRQQFYTVLLNRALIGVQEESVSLLQTTLRDQQNRFEAGTVPRFNVLQAEVELANAQPTLIRARNTYRTSQLTLAKLVGVSWPTTSDLTPYPIKGVLGYTKNTVSLDEAVQLAKERRAFLKVQREAILSQVENIKIALAGYQPTVNASAGYQIRNGDGLSINDEVDGWFFGFTGGWNIFDGFATAGKVQQARASLESAKVTYDDSVRQVELEVQTAFLSLEQGRELIESQQKTVEQAQESLRLANERLSAGAGTQLDVLNARVSLTQAQTTALQAVADYNTTQAEFDRTIGATTSYHDTFADPLASKKARKLWLAKINQRKPTLTDAELRDNLNKRRKAAQ